MKMLLKPTVLYAAIAAWITTAPCCYGFSGSSSLSLRQQSRTSVVTAPFHRRRRHVVIVSSSQRPSPQQQSSFNKENIINNNNIITSQVNQQQQQKEEFWNRQQELAEKMSQAINRSIKAEQLEKFAKRRMALVGDTGYFTALLFASLWMYFDNPLIAISYLFGAMCGLAYAYGLGKYVETLGGSVDDEQEVQGAGFGAARFAFLILLFALVGKFKGYGLMEIPAIMGFFTYQLASLSQGLREIND